MTPSHTTSNSEQEENAMRDVRTVLRDDLVAAKARVNTLHKWRRNGGMLAALRSVIGDDEERVERANQALGLATPPLNTASRRNAIDSRRRITSPEIEHADVMAIFDRAIALAEPTP